MKYKKCDRVKIVESLLPDEDYSNLVERSRDLLWYWQTSLPLDQNEILRGGSTFMISDVKDDSYYHDHILSYIQDRIERNVEPIRIYFNAQATNFHGSYHTDEGDVTAILYVNQLPYQHSWGGWTELFDELTKDQKMIPPIDNNLLLFQSDILHRGIGFLCEDAPMRINLTYKLKYV